MHSAWFWFPESLAHILSHSPHQGACCSCLISSESRLFMHIWAMFLIRYGRLISLVFLIIETSCNTCDQDMNYSFLWCNNCLEPIKVSAEIMDHVVRQKSTKYVSVVRAVKLSSDDLVFVRTGGREPWYVKFLDLDNQRDIVAILSSQLSKKFVFTNIIGRANLWCQNWGWRLLNTLLAMDLDIISGPTITQIVPWLVTWTNYT